MKISYRRYLSLGALVLSVLSSHGLEARAATITMDEVDSQPVNGLDLAGVTFGFTVGGLLSTDATIHAFGVGDLVYLSDPSLEGSTAGQLTFYFARPTDTLSFGIALQSEQALSQAVAVSLYTDSNQLLTTQWLDVLPLMVFDEARFEYSGQPLSMARIEFADPSMRFALDNLSYAASAVPEPQSWQLILFGVCILIAGRPLRKP
jgi:hypothetical protein